MRDLFTIMTDSIRKGYPTSQDKKPDEMPTHAQYQPRHLRNNRVEPTFIQPKSYVPTPA